MRLGTEVGAQLVQPTRVELQVELGMQVLSYMEFTDSSIGRDAFLAYQKSKENLAQRSKSGSAPAGFSNLLPR